ncbi:hypothetical protein Pint_07942 [Pistacia integerrima]|uniref:Uncharacterized protein n=1 Tax=Pistacia integerrima TaxID=434235 RepID=A0ACC0Y0C5_9ROSI|nr:hypothetical protein Pint_07942 [Pistacia integerrima]
MADQEEEDLKMALRMSMQHTPPEPKRSKPRDAAVGAPVTSPEDCRRTQRELMAAAAEKRMKEAKTVFVASNASVSSPKIVNSSELALKEKVVETKEKAWDSKEKVLVSKEGNLGKEEANQLFSMLFGSGVSKDILAQWSNQGIRFSSDPETSMGLVQHEGGPCGVLATIQAFVLKYLLFFTDELGKVAPNARQNLGPRSFSKNRYIATSDFASLSEHAKLRALVKSMSEILFLCGNNKRAVIATLTMLGHDIEGSEDSQKDEVITKALEGLSIESGSDLQKVLRVDAYTSQASVLQRLEAMIPAFQSRMGAMLFLISALLSRGLVCL